MRRNIRFGSIIAIIVVGAAGYLLFNPEKWFSAPDQDRAVVLSGQKEKGQDRKTPPQYRFSISTAGRSPQALTVANGRLYVAYQGLNMIDVLDFQGERLAFFDPYPQGRVNIVDLAADDEGNIYLADAQNRSILVFDRENSFLNPFPPRKIAVDSEDFLRLPTDIAINRGLFFITDPASNAVKGFLKNGEYVLSITGVGAEQRQGWHPMNTALTWDGRVLVSDILNHNVAVFSCAGKFAYFFAKAEGPEQLTAPGALAIDGLGRVHAVDSVRNWVFVYDNYGKFLLTYGQGSKDQGRLNQPTGIAIDGANKFIFIADADDRQIKVWSYQAPD